MKGVILAGGKGTRLGLSTKVTNKHLLPVHDKPMIEYGLQVLIKAGIKEILIVTGPEHMGDMINYLGSGKSYGVRFTYKVQDEAGGIAQALGLAEDFTAGNNVAVILGDNIYEDSFDFSKFESGAKVFLKEVKDPEKFGVAEITEGKVVSIEEKPKEPRTNYAVTGLYLYDNKVFDMIRTLKPSNRGELEITDVNNEYIKKEQMKFDIINGFWTDAGTIDNLHKATSLVREKKTRDGQENSF